MKNISLLRLLLILICTNPLISCQEENKLNKDLHIELPTFAQVIQSKGIDASDSFIIEIDKTDYTLEIKWNKQLIKRYPVVFGGNPIDDKRQEGDLRTPEGSFAVKSKFPHKKWSKFIWVDYPNAESYVKFEASVQNGELSNDATIGGEIGIHGVPDYKDYLIDQKTNWTLGCIALKNKDINDFYQYVGKHWTIEIHK